MMIRENLRVLPDQKILESLRDLVEQERKNLVLILRHLREVERRKLFSDLGYQSLFEYAVRELKYGEGQAGRRIQAMRILKELPQLEEKVENGTLSLTNISQAQSCFREIKITNSGKAIAKEKKLEILKVLENKTSREGYKEILKIQESILGCVRIFPERERVVSAEHVEMRFLISRSLKEKLDKYKSLLGAKSYDISFAEMIESMAEMAIRNLEREKFGRGATPAPESLPVNVLTKNTGIKSPQAASMAIPKNLSSSRYIGKNLKALVWARDQGRCVNCQGKMNLQFDHVQPVAFGGRSNLENLRLLCHHCNQRAGIRAGLVSPR